VEKTDYGENRFKKLNYSVSDAQMTTNLTHNVDTVETSSLSSLRQSHDCKPIQQGSLWADKETS